MVISALIAIGAGGVVAAAERLHARRVRAAAHLAFGPGAAASRWTRLAPAVRVIGMSLAVFGALLLIRIDPAPTHRERDPSLSRRLLICLDVSPSMLVQDAGPDVPKVSRAAWAGRALRPLLDSAGSAEDTSLSLVIFHNGAMPLLIDTYDKDVIYNLLDGMRLDSLFRRGSTDLQAGVNAALETARRWARDSATLVIVSDGDSDTGLPSLLPKPPSIAQTIVVGVGDTQSTSEINGVMTRQDAGSLRLLSSRLGGRYYDCNRQLVPPLATERLISIKPRSAASIGERAVGLASVGAGALITGCVGPLLIAFGRRDPDADRSQRTRANARSVRAIPPPSVFVASRHGELP